MSAASNRKAPSIAPITIPAMAPPESPRVRRETAVGAAEPVAVAEFVAEPVGCAVEKAIDDADVAAIGKTTP